MKNKKADDKFLGNKKAQELSVTTIILMVLGVTILVILILGFTLGWDVLKEWLNPSSNVNNLVNQCKIACTTEQKYDYCYLKRELKTKEENSKEVTCYSLNKKRPQYGIPDCLLGCVIPDIKEACTPEENTAKTKKWYLNDINLVEVTCGTEQN